MSKTVNVTVYELRWPGTTEVYVGSTVKLSDRLRLHRHQPCACYQHLDINQAEIVPALTYRTSDRFNRRPEAAHKVQLRKQNIKVLSDPNDNHNTPLWHSAKTKARMSASLQGKYKGAKHPRYAPFTVTFPDGTVHHWDTTYEAAPHYSVSRMAIHNYLHGKTTPGKRKESAHLLDTIWAYV